MKKIFVLTATVIAGLALHGCATMSAKECHAASSTTWDHKGYIQGSAGSSYNFSFYAEACAKVGVNTDEVSFKKGYERGIRAYCTPAAARKVGEIGNRFNDANCPAGTDLARLRHENTLGLEYYRTNKRIEDSQSEIRKINQQIKNLNDDKETAEYLKRRSYYELQQRKQELQRQVEYGRDSLYYMNGY
ncbi:MAG: DUF2799 domain-containing protein [Acinetobacter sp.]|nr:DUF2799 domain-containing protein [Acinetobacter sp.]